MDDFRRKSAKRRFYEATGELAAAQILTEGQRIIPDAVGYRCHQAAEKSLKAFLLLFEVETEEKDDLGQLMDKAVMIEPCFATWREAANRLSLFAAPGEYSAASRQPDHGGADEALDDATCIYRQVQSYLPM